MARLKVYRTAIGFDDAYVAAPSQKAALAAWGSDNNLFARGVAEVVTDPQLTAAPLAQPGQVIRKSRGSLAEQLRALGPTKRSKRAQSKSVAAAPPVQPARPKKRKPAPSRESVAKAEAVLAAERERAARELAKLRDREQALAREREKLEVKQRSRQERLRERLDAARERHRAAFEAWAETEAEL
jgi:hypothetical protein